MGKDGQRQTKTDQYKGRQTETDSDEQKQTTRANKEGQRQKKGD